MTALRAEDEFLAERKDRFSGAVIGALAGDALGRRVRHLPWSAIEEAFGPRGVTELEGSPPGELMSDGAAAMALTLDGMIKADRALLAGAPDPLIELERVYEQWASGGAAAGRLAPQLPEHRVGSRYILQLRERLGLEDGFRSELPEVSPLYSAIPMGLWESHPVAVFELVDRVMGFTGESEATVGASRAAAVLIQQNIMTGQYVRGFGQILEADRRHYPASLRKSLEAAQTLARRPITPERIENLGTGEDPESALAIAACAVHAAEMDFDEAVRIAVNHSGDSAITGALAGAIMGSSFTGQDRIPVHWASGLMSAKVLVKLANDAGEQFAENPRDDAEWHHRYPITARPPERGAAHEVLVSEREELFLRHWRDFWWNRRELSRDGVGNTFPRLAEEALGADAVAAWWTRVREGTEVRWSRRFPKHAGTLASQVERAVPGLVLGAAVGDAVGWRACGADAGSGQVTAATQLMAFAVEGLIGARVSLRSSGWPDRNEVLPCTFLGYQVWMHAQGREWSEIMTGRHAGTFPQPVGWLSRRPELRFVRAPDERIADEMREFSEKTGRVPADAQTDSRSCGPLMSALPLSIWCTDPDELVTLATRNTAMTHGPVVRAASAALAVLCNGLVRERALPDAVAAAVDAVRALDGASPVLGALEAALALSRGSASDEQVRAAFPRAAEADQAVGAAVCVALLHQDDAGAALRAAAGGGSWVAAICGALLGIGRGVEALPAAEVAALDVREVLEQLARDAVVEFGSADDPDDPEWFSRYGHGLGD
ncbi:ADP-ribosylglycohydrolase family protein [Saccharopolyspora sp. CA-218241]|uniref:ADP-ribosylglycohydrolase family protein n=1 Tax=Saccharopolyspora sp. CA-218241 TaxID=3240027 RepID=UPI003D9933FE